MPAKVNRLVSVSEVLASHQAAVTKLQTFPPNGMTELASYVSASGGTFTSASETQLGSAATPSFTLVRPVPIMVVGTITFGPEAAAAGNVYVRAGLTTGQLYGEWCECIMAISTGTLQLFVPGTSIGVGIVPAGTYTARWTGETTPGTALFTQVSLFVFQLAG